MDLLSLGSTSLASIVGLVTQFAAERRHAATLTAEEFTAWLAQNRHEEVVRLLEQNANSLIAVRILLSQDRADLFKKLAAIDRRLAIIAGSIEGFAQVASAIHPYARISNDAKKFLRDFEMSGGSKAIEFPTTQEHIILVSDATGNKGELRGGWRFFDDDISLMVEAGLLKLSRDGGRRILFLTRDGADFANSLHDAEL